MRQPTVAPMITVSVHPRAVTNWGKYGVTTEEHSDSQNISS